MCILVKKQDSVGEIAQEDIVCYKVLRITDDKRFVPFIYMKDLTYVLGTTYRNNNVVLHSPLDDDYNGLFVGREGFHSFVNLEDAIFYYQSYKVLYFKNEMALCKFVIPKGTRFYKGESSSISNDNYFSESIRFAAVLKDFDGTK